MTIRLEGLDQLIRKIETLAQLKAVGGALLAGGAHMKTQMQEYPPANRPTRASVYGKTFQSEKQRRYFFWAMRTGRIQVPYRRRNSGGLAGRWTVAASENGLRVEVSNSTPYGPLVQGHGTQSRYMKAVGWQTERAVLDREGPRVVQYVKAAIDEALSA